MVEVTRTLVARFGKTPQKALYREAAMREFFSGSLVENYQHLIPEMENHPKDRHVLAAAVACRADCLVTFNLKDFPLQAMAKYKIEAIGPSTFLKRLFALDPALVEEKLREQAAAIRVPLSDLLDRLADSLPAFVSILRTHLQSE